MTEVRHGPPLPSRPTLLPAHHQSSERENGDSGNDPEPDWRQMADVSNGVSNRPEISDG
jgi:hypothetical protein